MRAPARRPDQDHHRAVEKPDGDKAILAIVPPAILDGQRGAREHLSGPGHIQSSGLKGGRTLCRIEFDWHDFMLLHLIR